MLFGIYQGAPVIVLSIFDWALCKPSLLLRELQAHMSLINKSIIVIYIVKNKKGKCLRRLQAYIWPFTEEYNIFYVRLSLTNTLKGLPLLLLLFSFSQILHKLLVALGCSGCLCQVALAGSSRITLAYRKVSKHRAKQQQQKVICNSGRGKRTGDSGQVVRYLSGVFRFSSATCCCPHWCDNRGQGQEGNWEGAGQGVFLPLTCLSWCKFAQFVALSLCLLWYLRALWRAQAAGRVKQVGEGAYLMWRGNWAHVKSERKTLPVNVVVVAVVAPLSCPPLSLSFARLLCTFACRFCIFKILLHRLQRTFATAVVVFWFCWVFLVFFSSFSPLSSPSLATATWSLIIYVRYFDSI